MPAPETISRKESRPALGHINLMVDTFIANASVDDLRSITRTLLATGPTGTVPAFITAARSRMGQTNAKSLLSSRSYFHQTSDTFYNAISTTYLKETLTRARTLYGAGMGFASLSILASIVRASVGMRWEEEGELTDVLAVVDADISQAIQSCKEELQEGNINNFSSVMDSVNDLRTALTESSDDVQLWGGEFPFERALVTLDHWKI